MSDLDPYLMMMERVERYLMDREEAERVELARRCFYFKAGERLSEDKNNASSDWRRRELARLVEKWKWHPSSIYMLDRRNEWKLNRVRKERQALIGELTSCYRFLSEFARSNAGALTLIKPADLNVLGRKLYASFERKAGKIEILYRGITENLYEERISIHRLTTEDGKETWVAYEGVVKDSEVNKNNALRRAHSLIELICWCYFNRLLYKNTVIILYAEGSDLTEREVHSIVEQLERNYPEGSTQTAGTEDYRQLARIADVTTFINVGLDPFSAHSKKGRYLASNQTDALRYGGLLENLALSIDQLIISSWQETLTTRYRGINGLIECLRDYINWAPPSQGRRPPSINAVSFSSLRSNAIARRIEEVFDDVMNIYYDVSRPRNTQYVLSAEQHYYVLHMLKDNLSYERIDRLEHLYEYLSRPKGVYSSVVFDRETLIKDVLPVLYSYNRPNKVQYFYVVKNENIEIYVLDEKGALFTQTVKVADYICMLSHFQRLFESLYQRMSYRARDLGQELPPLELEVFRMEKNFDGEWVAEAYALPKMMRQRPYQPLQAIVDKKDGREEYTIYFGEREFTSLEFGDDLFPEVAACIVAERKNKKPYPIYVTDIDLSTSIIDESGRYVQSVQYLRYKKTIEEALNKAFIKLN